MRTDLITLVEDLPTVTPAEDPVPVICVLFEQFKQAKADDLQHQLYVSALLHFCLRILRAWVTGQIDNASLYAGSPMYYYCRYCGLCSDTMSEGWFASRPSQMCEECRKMESWLKDAVALTNHLGLHPPKGPYDEACPFNKEACEKSLVKQEGGEDANGN